MEQFSETFAVMFFSEI